MGAFNTLEGDPGSDRTKATTDAHKHWCEWERIEEKNKDTSKLSPKGFLTVAIEIFKGSKHHYSVGGKW